MISDVPLGAFFIRGIDSSLIVSIIEKPQKIKTFQLVLKTHYNESDHAKAICSLFRHRPPRDDFLEQIHNTSLKCAYYYDEPFSDSSMLPTMLVSAMAKQHVSVALTGDGGDELFAGYNRYHIAHNLWKKSQYLPKLSRQWVAGMMHKCSVQQWDTLAKIIPKTKRPKRFGQKVHKFASILPCQVPMNTTKCLYITSLHRHYVQVVIPFSGQHILILTRLPICNGLIPKPI